LKDGTFEIGFEGKVRRERPKNRSLLPRSHNLLRLRDGRHVLTHDACKPPLRTPLTLRLSSDDAASWGEPLTLAEVAVPGKDEAIWGRQVTYPSVVELAEGILVVVWSEIVLGNRVQYGDIRSARVRV
jgi:hypothetical protein